MTKTNRSLRLLWLWKKSLLLLLLLPNFCSTQTIIKNLPGFSGDLPFKLETGYVGVGNKDELQLFYYFIESERSPENDPLLLWITGGPRCSSFSGLVYENGPISFSFTSITKHPVELVLNPYSWTKLANIIFLDAPAGTGFSYSTTTDGYNTSDTIHAKRASEFLQRSTKRNCKGDYVDVDPNNELCLINLQAFEECISRLEVSHILTPACAPGIDDDNFLSFPFPEQLCRVERQRYSEVWANDMNVPKALNIRKGTKAEWARCNSSIPYIKDVRSSVDYHRNLMQKPLRAFVYSGDHDLKVPHISTEAWIESLSLPIVDDWKPWFSNNQVAGYRVGYSNGEYHLTYATIKGGGHTGPEFNPRESFDMIERWLEHSPL
ncbi:serine carboxypeptidase-like 18 isoform X2 [Prunus dulcis]|uniref:serine carboxypeptidase-like 18 isoform X2 n=1 Tax=Prunus dulcis TaxID=3755 RepID=UPI0014826C99|nr:serine carboxypeptidase-like 18 isoform X2 [Prunus dulcis]